MTPKEVKHASKFLSLILRHRPEVAGITLDEAGWVDVSELLTAFQTTADKPWYTKEVLSEVVDTNDKKRFEYSEDGTRIRASQGHSLKVDLGYEETEPPSILYHGTATRFMDKIQASGLSKMQRHHVHLSADLNLARSVGTRHGKPVVVYVDAEAMHQDGHKFYVTPNGVWLTDNVASHYFLLN